MSAPRSDAGDSAAGHRHLDSEAGSRREDSAYHLTSASGLPALDRVVRIARNTGIPGAHLSLAIPGGVELHACRGAAQRFSDSGSEIHQLTPAHAHDLGSVTKVAGTTALLASLLSDGALSLHDAVTRYLPSASDPVASATLEDLLRHRAGLWEWWPTYLSDEDPITTIAQLPLRYAPRTDRHYSDLGFMLLGAVVEKVAAQPLASAYRSVITRPASIDGLVYATPPAASPCTASSRGDHIERKMVHTGHPYPVERNGAGRFPWREHVLVGEVNDGNAFHSFGGSAGHAGMFGTTAGLHALGRLMLDSLTGDGPWPGFVTFTLPGPDVGQLAGLREWVSHVDGCRASVLGHPGFPGVGFGLVPRHNATIVLATNRLHVDHWPVAFDALWQMAIEAAHHTIHLFRPISSGLTRNGPEGPRDPRQ